MLKRLAWAVVMAVALALFVPAVSTDAPWGSAVLAACSPGEREGRIRVCGGGSWWCLWLCNRTCTTKPICVVPTTYIPSGEFEEPSNPGIGYCEEGTDGCPS